MFRYNAIGIGSYFAIMIPIRNNESVKRRITMDIGNMWNSLYTSQMIGTQMYGLQSDPYSVYGSYADAWQASPWQYGLQAGSVYGNPLQQTWQNAGFIDTLNDALTKYEKTSPDGDLADTGMDISTHEGNVLQLGYDKALVYLPEEQKIMIVQTAGSSSAAENEKIDEKGIQVNQRHARASAAYRRTQSARQRNSLWAKEGNNV